MSSIPRHATWRLSRSLSKSRCYWLLESAVPTRPLPRFTRTSRRKCVTYRANCVTPHSRPATAQPQTSRQIIGYIKDGGIVPDNQIDFFSFRIRTLHGVSDYHGPNSLQTKEAKKLLGGAIQDLSEAFVTAYDGSVLVTVVSTNVAHTRRQPRSVSTQDLNYTDRKWPFDWLDTSSNLKKNRYKFKKSDGTADYEWMSRAILDPNNATEPSTPSNSSDTTNNTNTATDEFEVDYPAIFNIFLWFGIIMTFSLLAIMYSMMDMDPGRDSIIYRMTNTRMKKDN
ncbi:unnamed protein product [Spodoptera exigua]|nr:unnamed protein product [Spodoptera exigua]